MDLEAKLNQVKHQCQLHYDNGCLNCIFKKDDCVVKVVTEMLNCEPKNWSVRKVIRKLNAT